MTPNYHTTNPTFSYPKALLFILLAIVFANYMPSHSYAQTSPREPSYSLMSITQTALNLPKGQLTYRNTLALHNEFNYGITDYLSVSASLNSIGLINQNLTPPVGINLKLSTIPKGQFNVAGSIGVNQFFKATEFFEPSTLQVETQFNNNLITRFNLAATYGNYKNNIGVALDGFLFSNPDILKSNFSFNNSRDENFVPNFSIYGTIQIGKKAYLTIENSLFVYSSNAKTGGLILANIVYVGRFADITTGIGFASDPKRVIPPVLGNLSFRVPFGRKS